MSDVILRGGSVVARGGPVQADVAVERGRISAIGDLTGMDGAQQIDCSGRLVMPGFIDTHSHADARVLDDDVQLALLRQGVTTIIAGQDGVSFAPGSARYAKEYFAALNGDHPHFDGGSVGELLDSYGPSRTAVNVAYLVPHGTVRAEVMGFDPGTPTPEQLSRMRRLVEQALEDGAVGMSTGMDYFPGSHGLPDEIAALCAPLREASGLYVTHMRGGYEDNADAGVAEVEDVIARSGVRAHISHYHGPAEPLARLIDTACDRGADLTFDSYPYRSGFTLLTTILMPPGLRSSGFAGAMAALDDGSAVRSIAAALGDHESWADAITLAHVADDGLRWAEGHSLTAVAERMGASPVDAAVDLLRRSGLGVSAVFGVGRSSNGDDIAALARHSRHMTGSDGIYVGTRPHPRAWGTFARMLGRHTRERGDWTWADAVEHLSARPAERFRLGERGRVEVGAIADLVVVDPERVADTATYETPKSLAVGIDDVLVAGEPVLRGGALMGARPGAGLRRG